jgi:phosphotransferase system  glucose/maltose/N-acetylglucosamine-specific IIC component
VTSAKNTILYSVIGLGVAVLAFFIVNFVIDLFATETSVDPNTKKDTATTRVKSPDEVND